MLSADDRKLRVVDACLEHVADGIVVKMRKVWTQSDPMDKLDEFRRQQTDPSQRMELTDPSAMLRFACKHFRELGIQKRDATDLREFRNQVAHKNRSRQGAPVALDAKLVETRLSQAASMLGQLGCNTLATKVKDLLQWYLIGAPERTDANGTMAEPRGTPDPPTLYGAAGGEVLHEGNAFSPSPDQQEALDAIQAWWKGGTQRFVLGGLAGSGKTRLVPEILRTLGLEPTEVRIAAPTNKACEVLRARLHGRVKCDPSTIHKLLYRYAIPPSWDGEDMVWKVEGLKPPAHGVRLVVCDEASMLTTLDVESLEGSYRVLYLGCEEQLPAIAKGDDWMGRPLQASTLCTRPDKSLTSSHRHANESTIRQLAWGIARENLEGLRSDGSVEYLSEAKGKIDRKRFARLLADAHVVLVARNVTRVRLNQYIREVLGHRRNPADWIPKVGELLVAHESTDIPDQPRIPNGQQLVVEAVHEVGWVPKASTGSLAGYVEVEARFRDMPSTRGCWKLSQEMLTGRHVIDDRVVTTHVAGQRTGLVRCDWGYALTVHKAQGSEWDRVVIVDDGAYQRVGKKRWLYTSITRAKERVSIVVPKEDTDLF